MIVNPTRPGRSSARACALGLLLAVSSPMLAAAQQPAPAAGRALSLDDAIRIAARESEVLQMARAGISRAAGQVHIARSEYLPQVGGNLTYARAAEIAVRGARRRRWSRYEHDTPATVALHSAAAGQPDPRGPRGRARAGHDVCHPCGARLQQGRLRRAQLVELRSFLFADGVLRRPRARAEHRRHSGAPVGRDGVHLAARPARARRHAGVLRRGPRRPPRRARGHDALPDRGAAPADARWRGASATRASSSCCALR